MSDIDVEAVDEVDPDVPASSPQGTIDEGSLSRAAESDAPEYVLYGGKGGVGKTTCAAATALASAADGTATLVVSTDPAHSLSDALEVDVPVRPSRIREDVPLFGAEIDPDEATATGPFGGGRGDGNDAADGDRDGQGPGNDAAGPLGDLGGTDQSPMGAILSGPVPGADEAAAMQQLLDHLDDPRFERVVVDTAPTGHTLRLLQLPDLLDSMVGRLAKLRQRFSGMMEGTTGLFGAGDGGAGGPDLDDLGDRVERLRAALRDPERTDFRVVMVPEETSVIESERLVSRLEGFEIPVGTLVVNRVMEDPADVAQVTEDDVPADDRSGNDRPPDGETSRLDPEWVVTPDLSSCAFCQRRWEVQKRALSRATDLFRGREVKRVPLLAEEVRGEDALGVVAACLA